MHGRVNLGLACAWLSYFGFLSNGILFRNEYLYAISGVAGIVALVQHIATKRTLNRYFRWMLGILALSIPLVIVKSIFFPVTYMFLIVAPGMIGVSIFISRYPRYFPNRKILFILLAYFFGVILLGGSAEEVFAGSRNQISVIMISLCALSLALEQKRSDLFFALAVFAACVIATGTGGIIASAVLLLAILFRQQITVPGRLWTYGVAVAAVAGFAAFYAWYAPEDFLNKLSWTRILGQDVRFQILSLYFEQYMSGVYLVLGAPDNYAFQVFDYFSFGSGMDSEVRTLHNSYLSLHAKVGMLSALIIALLAAVVWALRAEAYFLLLFAALLVRAFSDSVYILDGYYNFAFFYFFIVAARLRAEKSSVRVPVTAFSQVSR